MQNIEERILKQLPKRKSGYTSAQLATALKNDRNYVQRTLRKLVQEFKVERRGTASRHGSPTYTLYVQPT